MNHTSLAHAILLASPKPAVQSSVNTDTRLLLSTINAINKQVNTSMLGHKDGPTGQDVEKVFKKLFPEQEQVNALVHFVFDCRYGWSERTSDATGHTLEPPPSSMHSPARSGGAAARKRVIMGSVSAQSKKKTLNDAADALIDVLFELPTECRILLALQNCTIITTKPVVRQQVLVHFYSWLKHYLRTRSIITKRKTTRPGDTLDSSLNINTSSQPNMTSTVEEMSPKEYECAMRLIILSLTDVWSAIRKASSAHLYSIIDLFPMEQVRKLFQELCDICNGTITNSSTNNNQLKQQRQRSGSPTPSSQPSSSTNDIVENSSTTSSTAFGGKIEASPWQGKNGALMGITVIIKKFRRQTRFNRKHPSPTTAWLAAVEESSPEAKMLQPTPSPKSPNSTKLSLNLLSIDGNESPPASPAGRAQRFTDWNTTTTTPAVSSATSTTTSSNITFTTSTTPSSTDSKTSNLNRQQNVDQSISPLGLHHGGSTLTFGMHYQCDGLPDFICQSIHGVTFTLIGHGQLSVRENATRAFAAFLSRCPPNQTINAFSNVIDRLYTNFESSLKSERGSYLAEGLLGLCVILAKLRLIPSKYMISNWNHIYSTLEGYLGHPASTVRQMSSTVFKHLAFRTSKGLAALATSISTTSTSTNSGSSEDKESFLMLVAILRRLVFRWTLQNNVHSNVRIPISKNIEANGFKDEELTWQSLEGRLLVYELLVGYLLANHRHFLAIDMASGRSAACPSYSRRASVGNSLLNNSNTSPSSSPETNTIATRKRSNTTPDANPLTRPDSPSSLLTPARATNGTRRSTPNDVMSPDPTASPALAVFPLTGSPHHTKTDANASRRSSTSSSTSSSSQIGGGSGSTKSNSELQSILTTLQQADDVTLDESSIFWNANCINNTENVGSGEGNITNSTITVRKLFCDILQMMLLQTKECLTSKRFELRRMADQVLKPLSELVFYYDPFVMRGHWDHVAEWLSAKDTLSCRFTAETMLCCIKHVLSVSLSTTSMNQQDSKGDLTSIFGSSSFKISDDGGSRREDEVEQAKVSVESKAVDNPSKILSSPVLDNIWTRLHAEQRECLFSSLKLILPALHNLAKKAVTERLAAAIFELMVVVHSLFNAKPIESSTSSKASTRLSLMYPMNDIHEHLDIVIGRVINIHELAHNITLNKPTISNAKKVSAAILKKRRRRAITLDPVLAISLIPHLPTLLSNPNTTIKQQLQLLPVVLRWTLTCDAVEARISLLDTVLYALQNSAMSDALCDEGEENSNMLMASVDPICQLVERSLEAPVLGSVLEVVLGMTSTLPTKLVPPFLAKVLPSAAKRLKQAAPQVCLLKVTCFYIFSFLVFT
jgi:hypothetical protein